MPVKMLLDMDAAAVGIITPVTWDGTTAILVTLSGGDLVATNTGTFQSQGVQIAVGSRKTSGKYYVEFTLTALPGIDNGVVGAYNGTTSYVSITNNLTNGAYFAPVNGHIFGDGVDIGTSVGARSAGDVIGCAIDLNNYKAWFRVAPSGNWNGGALNDPVTTVGGANISAGTIGPVNAFGGAGGAANNIITTNFGGSAFSGAVPSGFTSGWTV